MGFLDDVDFSIRNIPKYNNGCIIKASRFLIEKACVQLN